MTDVGREEAGDSWSQHARYRCHSVWDAEQDACVSATTHKLATVQQSAERKSFTYFASHHISNCR